MKAGVSLILMLMLCFASLVSAQEDPNCPGAPVPRLVVGEMGRVVPGDPNNMRDAPSRSGAQIGAIAGGDTFDVLDGPVCSGGLNWWQVDYKGQVGWTVEGTVDEYWIEPYDPNPPTATPLPPTRTPMPTATSLPAVKFEPLHPVINVLEVGGKARVISDDPRTDDITLLVRSEPAKSASVVTNLVADQVVTLLAGPVDADSLFWWQIETPDGKQGWVVEALPNIDTGKLERTLLAECKATENRIAFSIERYLYTSNLDGSELCMLDRMRLPEVHTFYQYAAYFPNTLLWSPDRTQFMFIDFAEDRPFDSLQDLFILSADGLTRRQVTVSSEVIWADWSPDGQRILLTQALEGRGKPQVWTMKVDGTVYGALTSNPNRKQWAYWLADSETVLYVENIGEQRSQMGPTPQEFIVYTVNILKGGLKELYRTTNDITSVQISEDRSKLVIVGWVTVPIEGTDRFMEYAGSEALILDLVTGEITPLSTDIPVGTLLPDGNSTFVLNINTGEITLRSLATDELTVVPLSQPLNKFPSRFGWLPDGRWLLLDQGGEVLSGPTSSLLAIDVTTGNVTTLVEKAQE